MTLFLAAVLTALLVSALCSLVEATLLSLTPSQVAEMGERRPRAAAIWERFKRNIEGPIATILVLNTAAHTIGATVAGAEFERLWGERWLLVFSVLLTYVMLQFTEILPETLGVSYNRRIAPLIARPLEMLTWALSPILGFIHLVNRPIERLRSEPQAAPIDEIRALASMARTAKAIDPQQARLVDAASRLPDMRANQIMTPRPDVVFLRIDQPVSEILRTVQRSPFTRLPLCDKDLDHVIGMIHARDLFNHLELVPRRLAFIDERDEHGRPVTVVSGLPGSRLHVIGSARIDFNRIKRNVMFVPETLAVPSLLKQLQESRIHMAVVVDEYGGTQGVVTLEDILEEMVGDIRSELDVAAPSPFEAEGDVFRVRGGVGLHELREHLGLVIEDEDVATLNGYLVNYLGRLPEVGDRLTIGTYEAKLLAVERRTVKTVELRPLREGEEPPPA